MRYELRGVLVKVDVLIHDPMDDEEAIRPSRGRSSLHVSNVTTRGGEDTFKMHLR